MVDIEERFNRKEDMTLCVSEDSKRFPGVSKVGNKWRARIRDHKLKSDVYLGTYSTPEEAALVVNNKQAEFEKFNGNEDLKLDDTNGFSEVGKRFLGVSKCNNKWRARVRHPKRKLDINLGAYSTTEEAEFVVNWKKAEFKEMLKGENSMNVETCSGDFERETLPIGVRKMGNGKWGAGIWHPKLNYYFPLGFYSTPEEAALVVKKKKAEFKETSNGENSMNVEETDRDDFEREKLPNGVRRTGCGTWDSRIWHPELKHLVSLGSYSSSKDAASAFNNKRTEFLKTYCWANRKTTSEISNGAKDWLGLEANDGPVKIECTDDLNNTVVNDESNYGVASLPTELTCEFAQCSQTSVSEPGYSNSAEVGDRSVIRKENGQKSGYVFDFEKATSSGIIYEYGQLVGEYSELDEQLGFSFPDDCDEGVADVR